jgi:hypothetical protein
LDPLIVCLWPGLCSGFGSCCCSSSSCGFSFVGHHLHHHLPSVVLRVLLLVGFCFGLRRMGSSWSYQAATYSCCSSAVGTYRDRHIDLCSLHHHHHLLLLLSGVAVHRISQARGYRLSSLLSLSSTAVEVGHPDDDVALRIGSAVGASEAGFD